MIPAFDPEVEETASLWAARLRAGNLKPEQAREFREWLQLSPRHGACFESYCADSASIDASLLVLKSEGLALEAERGERRSSPRAIGWIAGGLAVAAAAVAVLLWPASAQVYQTLPGDRNTVTLEDGTRVEMNANTRLTARLGRAQRSLELERGEALFIVTKDPARPFTVAVSQGNVRVTGTIFNVSAHSASEQSVTVLEGRVEVSNNGPSGAAVALHAGEHAALFGIEPAVRTLSAAELSRATSWRRGVVEFEGEPLRSALAKMAAYHGYTFDVSPQLDGLTLGGSYDLVELESFLNAIEQVLPLKVMRGGNKHLRIVPR